MSHQPPKYKRRITLIKPRLQLKIIGVFLGMAALAFLSQALLMAWKLTGLAESLPEGGEYLSSHVPGLIYDVLLFSIGLFLPLTLAVGVLVTFRVAGPLYRFEQYLAQIARGEYAGPCRIRKEDELHDLCGIINDAVDAFRAGRVVSTAPEDEAVPFRKAG